MKITIELTDKEIKEIRLALNSRFNHLQDRIEDARPYQSIKEYEKAITIIEPLIDLLAKQHNSPL